MKRRQIKDCVRLVSTAPKCEKKTVARQLLKKEGYKVQSGKYKYKLFYEDELIATFRPVKRTHALSQWKWFEQR